jgi:hypothetical protein
MRYLLIFFLFVSCKNNSDKNDTARIDSILNENEKLKRELNENDSKKSEQVDSENKSNEKYYYVLITYTTSGVLNEESYISWTDIKTVKNLNEEIKYRLMDEAEKDFLNYPKVGFRGIKKREFFSFDSYLEASKHLASKKSL